ncbi:lytic transglycosylase domain-containing protein [Paracraurococcus lichenis]|uniref:Lytic transglycosylase domain-containing protein n=1 Tax=Paracraurococcus lichenis TaxID=3064888 RepID=A0ABT9E7W9_9PROT|nr:lytic transglycosylase domain-containing protein [Paracraurococcus sp. LOR1-02]MDO9712297.1 lytic transglycosylase domain-containing protein [Paracraurococcus sp. LOR1-02]
MAIPYLACMMAVATFYGLPPRVLPAIQAVEGGQVGTVSRNQDGSEDLGVMQVNTRWLAPVAQVTGLPEGTVRERLVGDACFNIAAAGAILHGHLRQANGDLMRAVGNYHSRTPDLHAAYAARVLEAAARLFGAARGPLP